MSLILWILSVTSCSSVWDLWAMFRLLVVRSATYCVFWAISAMAVLASLLAMATSPAMLPWEAVLLRVSKTDFAMRVLSRAMSMPIWRIFSTISRTLSRKLL